MNDVVIVEGSRRRSKRREEWASSLEWRALGLAEE